MALHAGKWVMPEYKKGQVDWAGRVLIAREIDYDDLERSLSIISNWRSCHGYPLNTFQDTLRKKARRYDGNCIVAQRTKRLSSIMHKLARFPTMELSQMQDIGGCRAILESAAHVQTLVDSYRRSDLRHKLARVTNYIDQPRQSGYRGVHLLYQYSSDKERTSVFNGLRIEMQLRSGLQHAWATAVETVGTFTRQALKSSLGETEWLRFFALMASVIALREGCPLVPGTPTDQGELIAELRHHATQLDVHHRLKAFGAALRTIPEADLRNAHYFLLELDPDAQSITIKGFSNREAEAASEEYLEAERKAQGGTADAVLVSVDKLESLRRAYPNYFLDTDVFLRTLGEALEA